MKSTNELLKRERFKDEKGFKSGSLWDDLEDILIFRNRRSRSVDVEVEVAVVDVWNPDDIRVLRGTKIM